MAAITAKATVNEVDFSVTREIELETLTEEDLMQLTEKLYDKIYNAFHLGAYVSLEADENRLPIIHYEDDDVIDNASITFERG